MCNEILNQKFYQYSLKGKMCADFLDSGLEATPVWGRCVKAVGYGRGKDFKRLSAPYRLQFTTTFQALQ